MFVINEARTMCCGMPLGQCKCPTRPTPDYTGQSVAAGNVPAYTHEPLGIPVMNFDDPVGPSQVAANDSRNDGPTPLGIPGPEWCAVR